MLFEKDRVAMSIDYFELITTICPNTPILQFSITPIFHGLEFAV